MQRRKFIRNVAWLTGGAAIASCSPVNTVPGNSNGVSGRVLSDGKGLENVVVSDGYTVVLTDKKGRYELTPHAEAVSVFISTPAGYAFINEKGISRHYQLLQNIANKSECNFSLTRLSLNDNEHDFIIWADPQTRNKSDVEKMMAQSVPDVQKLVAAMGSGRLLHGITVGDIAWDDLKIFADYNKAVEQMGIPFFQCIGNHDMDYNLGGDETSDNTFQQTYGPTYYSFNRGQVHYVVLDDVRYLGKDRDYDGHVSQQQLEWLKKDLSYVAADKLIILCLHIPIHTSVKNKQEVYDAFAGRKVHIMSGHTHWHDNVIKDNTYEHIHGTVCGAWWTGDICGDGTPSGYAVYKVKGNELSWQYKSTGQDLDHQFNIFVAPYNSVQKQIKVNIWNYDPEWKTEYAVDGMMKGSLEQFEGFDPVAYEKMLGPDLPKPRGFAEPKMTKHLFRAFVPIGASEVTVSVTDRFGKKYTSTQKI